MLKARTRADQLGFPENLMSHLSSFSSSSTSSSSTPPLSPATMLPTISYPSLVALNSAHVNNANNIASNGQNGHSGNNLTSPNGNSHMIALPISDMKPNSPRVNNGGNVTIGSWLMSLFVTALPILAYCFASIMMTLTNKFVMSSFNFHMGFFLLAVQGIVCVALVKISALAGLISHKPLNSRDVKQWYPVSILLVFMLYTSTKSLEYLAIPLFTIFKNLTIIAIAYGEYYIFRATVTKLMLTSFSLMVLSAVIGGYTDIEFHLWGYIWTFLNCISTACYVLFLRKVIKTVSFEDFDSVYFNNVLSIPLLCIMSILVEDWSQFFETFIYESDASLATLKGLFFVIFLSGFSSFLISFSSVWCLRVTSSTTYSMVGALNKLPMAVFGMLFFKSPTNLGSILSVLVGFLSGVLYSYAKQLQQSLSSKV